ncbi:MAG TPA: twin-arginine translocase TatA/TatE family subunit [Pyrinomonadaceae bacterium]|jgi:sec-independent protein translocase protein TatA
MDKITPAIGLGTPELLLILAVVILLFGASRLPQLAKSLGKSKRAFREGQEEAEEEARLEEAQRRRERLKAAEAIEEDRVSADQYAKETKR